MVLPAKYIVDTNVAVTANDALSNPQPDIDWMNCALKCVELLQMIVNSRCGLVMDDGDAIFDEYKRNLNFIGQPGLGNRFFRWLHDNRYFFPEEDRVPITGDGVTYLEFPEHPGLDNFDNSDRKFIAVANNHPRTPKPTIFEATDSKWWGWRKALSDVGITVHLLGPEYIERVFKQKFPAYRDE